MKTIDTTSYANASANYDANVVALWRDMLVDDLAAMQPKGIATCRIMEVMLDKVRVAMAARGCEIRDDATVVVEDEKIQYVIARIGYDVGLHEYVVQF